MSKIELTEDAPYWYLLWSNQANALAIVTYLQALLPMWQGVMPSYWFIVAGATLNSAAFILKHIKQRGLHAKMRARELGHD